MPESLGARLRRQREDRQIPLGFIAEQTKISLSLLQGLEADDVSRWPTGIFRRAFVRSYAAAIGLEAEVVVREFQETHPDPAEPAAIPCNGTAVPIKEPDNGTGPPSRFRSLVGSAIGSLTRRQPTEPAQANDRRPILTSAAPATEADATEAPATEPPPVDVANAAAEETPTQAAAAWNPDVAAAAQLCTELGRVADVRDLTVLLAQAAGILGATGLVVWLWDSQAQQLSPVLAQGYEEKVLALVTPLGADESIATAAAFRSAQTTIVKGSDKTTGAVVVPLMARTGCAGVLAIELGGEVEQNPLVRALATIFASLIAPLIQDAVAATDQHRKLA